VSLAAATGKIKAAQTSQPFPRRDEQRTGAARGSSREAGLRTSLPRRHRADALAEVRMFPLSADKLPLLEIADCSREIKPRASQQELLALLEAAWWLGEITGDSDTCLQFLSKIFRLRTQPSLQSVAFITPDDGGPPIEAALASGGVDGKKSGSVVNLLGRQR
jgi:hypothetical protein